jgi:hypothetical protein
VLAIAVLGILPDPARAADVQAWNAVEVLMAQIGRARVEFAGTLRARDHLSDPYDARAGLVLKVPLLPRLTGVGGYLRRFHDPTGRSRHQQNRFYAGPRFLFSRRPVRAEGGWLYERHSSVLGQPGFNRYKYLADIERTRSALSPFLYVELAARDGRLVRSRHFAGVRLRGENGRTFEVGYQFETMRVGSAWAPRHSVRSTLKWTGSPVFHR